LLFLFMLFGQPIHMTATAASANQESRFPFFVRDRLKAAQRAAAFPANIIRVHSRQRAWQPVRSKGTAVHARRTLWSALGLFEGAFNITRHLAELNGEPRERFPLRRVCRELADNGAILRVIAKLRQLALKVLHAYAHPQGT
jgi:hypothetical protein